MKRKRIAVLHAQIPFARGGAELMVTSLANELRKRGYDTELISIPFRWYPENGIYDNMLSWRLMDLTEINGEKIDLVIPTKFPTYGVKHPNKVLWLMHQHRAAYDLYNNKEHFGLGTIENGDLIKNRIVNYDDVTLKEAKKVYTISQNVANRLKDNNGLEATKLYHPPALAGHYYCDKYEKYILSVGRLDPLKRVDLLITALKFCNNDITLRIAGKGPEMNNLRKLASDCGVEKRVQFLGFVSDEELLKLYANAKAVFFAPIDEDYGYVTLEAFLSKKPIITCNDSGGVLEFAENNENALVCKADPKDIGDAITQLMSSDSMCKEFGINGYNSVKEISWDNVVDKLTFNI